MKLQIGNETTATIPDEGQQIEFRDALHGKLILTVDMVGILYIVQEWQELDRPLTVKVAGEWHGIMGTPNDKPTD